MSCGAGWMANYCRGRERLQSVVNDWRSRARGRAHADREAAWEAALLGRVGREMAELRLTIATMLRLLQQVGIDPAKEYRDMPDRLNVFDKYLAATDDQGDGFAIAAEAPDEMLAELGELRLVVASMIRMLLDRGVLTADQLKQMAEILDAMDGQADGKLNGHLGADGRIHVDPPAEPDALDELSQAVEDQRRRDDPPGP